MTKVANIKDSNMKVWHIGKAEHDNYLGIGLELQDTGRKGSG